MATFTVQGVNALITKQQEESEAAFVKAQESKQKTKEVEQIQKTTMKQVVKQKERAEKLADEKVKRLLEMKVTRRFQTFEMLRERIPPLGKNPTMGELIETDELQKLELDLQGSEERLQNYLKHGALLLEGIWGDGKAMTFLPEHLRLNLSGLGVAFNSPQFLEEIDPLIQETVIEYPTVGMQSLPIRWATTIALSLFSLHAMNSNPGYKKVKEAMENGDFLKMLEQQQKLQQQEQPAPASSE